MKPSNHLWAIETTLDTGEKYLCWNHKGGKSLYWTSDKRQVAPLLFETKSKAFEAIKRHDKSKEKTPKGLFTRMDNNIAGPGKPVKVKIQVLN